MTATEPLAAPGHVPAPELGLTRELALAIGGAETLEEALRLVLAKICEATDWQLGEAWVMIGSKLEFSSAWCEDEQQFASFTKVAKGVRVKEGVGLPGHAWATRRPVWMRDVGADPRFIRTDLAKEVGLGSGMAVPVLCGEDDVAAVLSFFVFEPREQDEHLINVVSAAGAQLGALVRRKQAEDALRTSEGHLRAVMETAADAIVTADAAGNINSFNRAAELAFHYSAAEVIGRPLTTLMPERFHAAHARGFQRFLATREARVIGRTLELAGRRKDGSEFPLELALSTWNVDEGMFFTGVLRDITDRREAEEALRQSDRLKTALLRAVSHDLRSPLTAIVAAGEAISSPSLPVEGRGELASVIVAEASRLARLVDKLLDLSKLQGGAAAPRRLSCSIEEIVDAALEHVSGGSDGFRLAFDPDLPSVLADAAQLERVFANLLENARRYSGGKPVDVEAGADQGRLVVRICDHGPGIPVKDRARIFEPFYRGDVDDRSHRGSGLGLAIVKGFVEVNGGTVEVESGPGRGTTFVVALPAEPRPQRAEAPRAS